MTQRALRFDESFTLFIIARRGLLGTHRGDSKQKSEHEPQCRPHRSGFHHVVYLYFGLAEFVWSSAARSPFASFIASSFAQKCMKKRRGCSSNMWLCSAVTAIPFCRRFLMTGLTSFPVMTKSPVIAALPAPVG